MTTPTSFAVKPLVTQTRAYTLLRGACGGDLIRTLRIARTVVPDGSLRTAIARVARLVRGAQHVGLTWPALDASNDPWLVRD